MAYVNPAFIGLVLGTVVDTNDPQQTGRIKVMVPDYGDRPDSNVGDLPWATFVSPFGGTVNNDKIKRGPTESVSTGPVGYGFWHVPKIGSTVIVSCIGGDPSYRVWVGNFHTERLSHTIPHGRFILDGDDNLDGPFDSTENPIEPTYTNLGTAFGTRSGNYEWRTRGADYSATSTADDLYIKDGFSKKADSKDVTIKPKDGKTTNLRQGYSISQIEPTIKSSSTGKNYDSQVYSWTSPGFHSISMDDRKENCRIKIRTTAGHQVILDDTNERIYINTCEGKNWIELDQDGNIDIYATTKVNVRSEGDINFTADKTIRLHAQEAIHMYTGEMRIHTTKNFNVLSDAEGRITTAGTLHLKAGGQLLEQGAQIHLNGPTPTSALPAYFTNRVPAHEPWARMTMKESTTSHIPKYPNYDDPAIGTEDKSRGKYWRR